MPIIKSVYCPKVIVRADSFVIGETIRVLGYISLDYFGSYLSGAIQSTIVPLGGTRCVESEVLER